jgi:hypothetical protein
MNMHQLLLLAGAAVMTPSAYAAEEQGNRDPAGIRSSLELGVQVSDYRYTEPDFDVKIWGPKLGLTAAYTRTDSKNRFVKLDGRVGYGSLKYEGSGALNSVPDLVVEARGYLGRDFFPRPDVTVSPYAGLGIRHLYNDLRGTTSTGAAGYRRYSTYLYVPLGLSSRFKVSEKWSVSPTIEYDYFVTGRQLSQLSDAGPGFVDANNEQNKGYGYRLSLMVEKGAWAFGPWLYFWNIEDSDVVPIGPGLVGLEPQNETREYGVELRYRF